MRWLAGILLVIAASAASGETACVSQSRVDAQIDRLAQSQDPNILQTVDRIEGTGRRLLALRSYLRAANSIATRWSWTQAQIDNYRESTEYRALLAEIEQIRARFEKDNPGYQLYANTDVRSLDVQIERWNSNESVGVIAADLERAACSRLAKASPANRNLLRDFLHDWVPERPPPLAAPGLSLHGRARAIDFQVHQGNRVVAGADTGDIGPIWVGQGWGRKLERAVRGASTKFVGPLKMPNEPWHFEYQP
ncbi:hypothetical protein HNQ60_001537 [Povalibacter uvarum]|uniref:D-alanyl-D-alanine carboxypeptidase n=1 Tax=Povalibacter uvarum TaxID=732238 RepID=A0A841HJU8_9GAMM|nr:hypothetical protein [Povalibacter uvarum]MBB6092659.1 hypothetical protein [Povalibacter uvarum]